MAETKQTQSLPTPWRESTLYKYMKEVTDEGYNQMLEYEKAGGILNIIDKSAKDYYETYYKRHKKSKKKKVVTEDNYMETEEPFCGGSWEDPE